MTDVTSGSTSDRDLLERAEDALHSIALDLLAVSPHLKAPYTDMPEASPWSMFTGPQARRAHDVAMEIRRHLGLPHRWRTRAAGTPPLEESDVAAAAVAAERERILGLLDAWRCSCGEDNCSYYETRDQIATLIGDPDAT